MANFTTIQDLIRHSLFRGGELTQGALIDGDYFNNTDGGPVLGYINDVIEGLILGSPLGLLDESGRPMPAVDWWWSRKHPQGVLHLRTPITTGTVSIMQGQSIVTFSTLLTEGTAIVGDGGSIPGFIVGSGVVGGPIDLAGWRIRIGDSRFLPRIVSSDGTGSVTTALLDEPWSDETVTGESFALFKVEYDLATDFVRFAGQPTMSTDPYTFNVLDADTLEQSYPICALQGGVPRSAALIANQKIRLSHYPETLERVEYPYIYLPNKLTLTSTDLILPAHQRRILAIGAAYFILLDKSDSKAGDLRGEFGGLFRAMVSEHMRHQRKMSKAFGQIKYRLDQVGSYRLKTASGLVII